MTANGPRPARPAVSEARRDEIIAAAKTVFARNGFDATTIADVAKEADLPFDAVYQCFDSKDALFVALIAAQEYALRTHVAVALAASGSSFGYAEVPFRATLRAMLEYFDADRAASKLLFRDAYTKNNRFNERLSGVYERYIDDIETLVVAAQKRGDMVAAPSRLVAYTLTVLIGQIVHRRLTTDDGMTAAAAADFVVSLVMKGLRPE
ncbi:TetR/AcrR family transcriptional regulator [Mycobacterium sp.]|uniref:TetR/AcrR family transcriptional regulator n=1 Tax=Mycobacterium sp. TaxID=1785 RepID=UPI003BAF376C